MSDDMKKSRREFLTELGGAVGAIVVAGDLAESFPLAGDDKKKAAARGAAKTGKAPAIDFRYAPRNWQSTYCFPDDPFKSLVGKHGQLLYGNPGPGSELDDFAHTVSVTLAGQPSGEFVSQRMESPSVPIITTKLSWGDVAVTLTSFATNEGDEGRVDNLLMEFTTQSPSGTQLAPEVVITSKAAFTSDAVESSASTRDKLGLVRLASAPGEVFMVVDSAVVPQDSGTSHRYQFDTAVLSAAKPVSFFARFPQEHQAPDKVRGGFKDPPALLAKAKEFWQSWREFGGKVSMQLPAPMPDFVTASARNIEQAREVKNGKKVFEVGPTVYRGFWVVDGHFMLEAARYLGHDKEAQEGLEAMWDLQDAEGSFTAGAGGAHWKDTAVAVYSLVRHAELAQNWEFFQATYPDAHKAMMYLKHIRDQAIDDGTANGKYRLLPRGFGDSGIGGIRSEFTNTLWAIIAGKHLGAVADKFVSFKRQEVKEFNLSLLVAFMDAYKEEMRQHPNGFSYLPMLMKDDPQWAEKDERKQPRPQAAQIYMSQAAYPGLLFPKDHDLVKGHIALMKAVTEEDIPIETGWLTDRAAWPYNAAVLANAYLWAGFPDLAHKAFIGFLNHASPLMAWREEQSLKSNSVEQYVGDMPHNWASAECIRYMRHMVVMEEDKNLRLLAGITEHELAARTPISVTYSPTRWGRVTLSHEPIDDRHWLTKFKREDFNEKFMPSLERVIMPRKLPVNLQFDKMTGAHFVKNGPEVLIDPLVTTWEATWVDWAKS